MIAKIATLTEVKKTWTIDDLGDAHELLDLKEKQEAKAYERMRQKR